MILNCGSVLGWRKAYVRSPYQRPVTREMAAHQVNDPLVASKFARSGSTSRDQRAFGALHAPRSTAYDVPFGSGLLLWQPNCYPKAGQTPRAHHPVSPTQKNKKG